MSEKELSAWDIEYSRRGIPSSIRQEPSGVLLWAIDNWNRLTGDAHPKDAVDIGCGTGRNAGYLASLGVTVLGFDSSGTAIEAAKQNAFDNLTETPRFLRHDLALGIPSADSSYDLAIDIFVYKHQIDPRVRASYRRELTRILRKDGYLLLSLAGKQDGYYSKCPVLQVNGNPVTVLDPIAHVESVLFDFEDLLAEFRDTFSLEMCWFKAKNGLMHGSTYQRFTIATIWRPLL
jgi:SAM-dependent methyltransferase